MGAKIITVAPGIRARDHATRKNGVAPDRYFFIRHCVDGKQLEEGVGWASEGWTQKRVVELLGALNEAKRTGKGAMSLRARREAAQKEEDDARTSAQHARDAAA